VPSSLRVDGQSYVGTASVTGRHSIEISDVNSDVLDMFIDGAEAVFDINYGDFHWTIDLHGITAALSDAKIAYTIRS
jgi:hypothetical protein